MSHYYYVDTRRSYNDSHVLHTKGCRYLPAISDRKFLGSFYTLSDALQQAKKFYPDTWCCKECCPAPGRADTREKVARPAKKMDLRPMGRI